MPRRLTKQEREDCEAREKMQDTRQQEHSDLIHRNIPNNNMSDRQFDYYLANEIDRMCGK